MSNMRIHTAVTTLVLGASLIHSRQAHAATCDETVVSQADQDLAAVRGCDINYMQWAADAYKMPKDPWAGRGSNDACNILKEFAKHVNATYLLNFAVRPPPPETSGLIKLYYDWPFHRTSEYFGITNRNSSDWHNKLLHTVTDSSNVCPVGGEVNGFYGHTHTHGFDMFKWNQRTALMLSCKAYDELPGGFYPSYGYTPGKRASTLVHEGWHAWNHKHERLNQPGGAAGHEVVGPTPNCTEEACDHFYARALGPFDLVSAGDHKSLVSVYQVEMDAQCDLADHAQPWVPYSVREDAANVAAWTNTRRFVESVPYWCGGTRPLWGMRPSTLPAPKCFDPKRTSCAIDAECGSGALCGSDSCCIPQCGRSTLQCNRNYTCTSGTGCDPATGCCSQIL